MSWNGTFEYRIDIVHDWSCEHFLRNVCLTEVNWVNTLIPTVTYLILIYAGAQVDGKAEELRRKEWT